MPDLETLLREVESAAYCGAFLSAAMLSQAGQDEMAMRMARRAFGHIVEMQFDLIPEQIPAVDDEALVDLLARVLAGAVDSAVPVASIPEQPRPVRARSLAHQPSKRARTANEVPS
jgi:hypothetical protein